MKASTQNDSARLDNGRELDLARVPVVPHDKLNTEISRERLQRLLIEVMHGDLWKNPKPAKYSWCSVLGNERDYGSYLFRCSECGRLHFICPLDWGFLTVHKADLRATPTIRLVSYDPHEGSYDHHYNVVTLDVEWAEVRGEEILSHEYIHYILSKLFPRSSTSEKYDNVAEVLEDWLNGVSHGWSARDQFISSTLEGTHTVSTPKGEIEDGTDHFWFECPQHCKRYEVDWKSLLDGTDNFWFECPHCIGKTVVIKAKVERNGHGLVHFGLECSHCDLIGQAKIFLDAY